MHTPKKAYLYLQNAEAHSQENSQKDICFPLLTHFYQPIIITYRTVGMMHFELRTGHRLWSDKNRPAALSRYEQQARTCMCAARIPSLCQWSSIHSQPLAISAFSAQSAHRKIRKKGFYTHRVCKVKVFIRFRRKVHRLKCQLLKSERTSWTDIWRSDRGEYQDKTERHSYPNVKNITNL